MFERITIIGLGLIGSSIARGVREAKLASRIVGCDPDEVALAFARTQKFIDVATQDARAAVTDSDLIILAVPPAVLADVAQQIGGNVAKNAIVMDTASVKRHAMAAISPHIPLHVAYMPAHPIAGSEAFGVRAGRADLFARKRVIVTPENPADAAPTLQAVTGFWQALGARVEAMPAELHDRVFAYVSHLPHQLAFSAGELLAAHMPKKPSPILVRFMRLAQANKALWADIFLLNQDYMLSALDRYLDALVHIQDELAAAPHDAALKKNDSLAYTALFPRIVSSCLITTVMEAEKMAGFPFARFAGSGFADFTAPVSSQAPEDDIQQISDHWQGVSQALVEYTALLKHARQTLASGDLRRLLQ